MIETFWSLLWLFKSTPLPLKLTFQLKYVAQLQHKICCQKWSKACVIHLISFNLVEFELVIYSVLMVSILNDLLQNSLWHLACVALLQSNFLMSLPFHLFYFYIFIWIYWFWILKCYLKQLILLYISFMITHWTKSKKWLY